MEIEEIQNASDQSTLALIVDHLPVKGDIKFKDHISICPRDEDEDGNSPGYVVYFSVGVQHFRVMPYAGNMEQAEWWAKMFDKALQNFISMVSGHAK